MFEKLFRKKVKGEIGFLKLENWWVNTLTEEERQFLLHNVRYFDCDKDTEYKLLQADIASSSITVVKFANSVLTYIKDAKQLELAKKVVDVALERTILDEDNAFDIHLLVGQMGDKYYKSRDIDNNLNLAIQFYNRQISMSKIAMSSWKKECNKMGDKSGVLPSHRGYTQMAIILEKQGRYKEAYELCEKAKNEGWEEDWNKRMERLSKKINK